MPRLPRHSRTSPPAPAARRAPPRARVGLRTAAATAPLLPALLAAMWLGACGGKPPAPGELRYVQDEEHSIANPGIIGASATGKGCGGTESEALTIARRIAQFNLRSLTGSARYNVRYNLVDVNRTAKGFCVEVSALAIEPAPYSR